MGRNTWTSVIIYHLITKHLLLNCCYVKKTLYLEYLAVEFNVVRCDRNTCLVICDHSSDIISYHSTLSCQSLINCLYSRHRLSILEEYVFCGLRTWRLIAFINSLQCQWLYLQPVPYIRIGSVNLFNNTSDIYWKTVFCVILHGYDLHNLYLISKHWEYI